MPIKPKAQKAGLRSSTQLSASEVQAFLDANLDSVSPLDSACYRNYAKAVGHTASGICRWRGLCGWPVVRR